MHGLIIGIATFLVISCSQAQKSPDSTFWSWFKENEKKIFDFENDREHVFDELQIHLHKVHPDLTFEFGPREEGKREFVISADGIKAAFPAVVALADAAPSLPRWKITKFRPRRGFQSAVTHNGLKISPEQVQFTVEPDGQKVGITLFILGYDPNEHDKYSGVAFLMLDQALGEYDVETKVGFIELRVSSTPSKLVKQPLSELTRSFDNLVGHDAKQ
jgi:hypothetical protein